MKLALSLASLLVVACSSSPAPEPAAPAPAEPAAAAPTEPAEPAASEPDIGEGIAWAEKSHDQKKAFMKREVVPAMTELWKESPEPDAKVNCMTCHGKGVMEGKFDMPNPDLPKLNPANQFAAHHDDADWLEFMGTKVTPTMVKLLEVEPFDPATHKGFSCFACHTMAEAKAGQ